MSTQQIITEPTLTPFAWYQTMREKQPIAFDEERGIWHVFCYDEVQRVLMEHQHFSSDRGRVLKRELPASLLGMDPPGHRQYRNLAMQAFTPRTVAELAPRISAIATELLDAVVSTGKMDVMQDFASQLPVIVIAELLGIPVEDRARFKHWSDIIISGSLDDLRNKGQNIERRQQANKELFDYFRYILEERRHRPQQDLISHLLAAEVDGQRLSENEVLVFCNLLLIAGNETTTNLIGNAIICFDEHPEALEQLRHDPSLLPGAIEEVLRYYSPVKMMIRFTAGETVLSKHVLEENQVVTAWIGSANRDERQFPDPDHFDIKRTPNRHLAFGHGIHFCLGAPLARLEAKIALGAMLERLPGLRRVADVTLEPLSSGMMFGVKSLPVIFQH